MQNVSYKANANYSIGISKRSGKQKNRALYASIKAQKKKRLNSRKAYLRAIGLID